MITIKGWNDEKILFVLFIGLFERGADEKTIFAEKNVLQKIIHTENP